MRRKYAARKTARIKDRRLREKIAANTTRNASTAN